MIRIIGNIVQLKHTVMEEPHKTLISYTSAKISVTSGPVAIFKLFHGDIDNIHTFND